MKSIFLLWIIFLSINSWAKKVKGLLIEQGDTTQVVFNIPVKVFGSISMEKIYNGVKIKRQGQKEVLIPQKGVEFVFTLDSKNYHFTSMSNYGRNHYPLFKKPGFQHRMGFMQTFYSSENIKYVKGLTFVEEMVIDAKTGAKYKETVSKFIDLIKIGYKSYFNPKPQNFKKEALFYFHSCPKLCDLIKNNKIGRHSFKKIAEIYEKECMVSL